MQKIGMAKEGELNPPNMQSTMLCAGLIVYKIDKQKYHYEQQYSR